MTPPRVAILTVTTNAADHIPEYAAAVARLSYPQLEIWVADNNSADGTPGLLRELLPQAHIVGNARNLGFTGACNRILRELLAAEHPPDYVLFLNDDTEPEPDLVERLLALADERTLVAPKTYLAGRPGILDDAVGTFDWTRGRWRERTFGRPERPADAYPHAVEVANLSCLLVPLRCFQAVGLLDDAFFVYYDDTDFCRRAREAGFRILYQPTAVVYHRKGATIGGQTTPFGVYYLTRNRPYLLRKHVSRPRFALFLAYFLAARAVRTALWALRGRWDLCRATWWGLWDFARGAMGPGRMAR
ncbi:N-acetylglucosaminyl-diphospho-decaprenol L-rhamnosyltransferase [bacterium HR29]|jgi:GT2 family glycosyltransferase|nr:N-acetylglucosaminyl-diphospho-decaprenol L-rhamnosyltransferase [bacterium HR29]